MEKKDYIREEVDDDRTYWRVYIDWKDVFYCSWQREAERVLDHLKEKRDEWKLEEALKELEQNRETLKYQI
jgi:hypothetical protein